MNDEYIEKDNSVNANEAKQKPKKKAKNPYNIEIGRRFQKIRKKTYSNLDSAAEALGCSVRYLRGIEQGETNITWKDFMFLCDGYEVSRFNVLIENPLDVELLESLAMRLLFYTEDEKQEMIDNMIFDPNFLRTYYQFQEKEWPLFFSLEKEELELIRQYREISEDRKKVVKLVINNSDVFIDAVIRKMQKLSERERMYINNMTGQLFKLNHYVQMKFNPEPFSETPDW